MSRCQTRLVCAVALAVVAALCVPMRAGASTITYFTDFTGNSGTLHAGWNVTPGTLCPYWSVTESGTNLTVTTCRDYRFGNGGVLFVQSAFTFSAPSDPAATVTLTVDLSSLTTSVGLPGETQFWIGL